MRLLLGICCVLPGVGAGEELCILQADTQKCTGMISSIRSYRLYEIAVGDLLCAARGGRRRTQRCNGLTSSAIALPCLVRVRTALHIPSIHAGVLVTKWQIMPKHTEHVQPVLGWGTLAGVGADEVNTARHTHLLCCVQIYAQIMRRTCLVAAHRSERLGAGNQGCCVLVRLGGWGPLQLTLEESACLWAGACCVQE
eukprot:1153799-Pelagomonas_calceolata.AAC.7